MSGSAPVPLGTVAHYTLLERLDPAGPGDLFRARDTRLGRTVTVRLLPIGYTANPAGLMGVARTLARLSHPNVLALFDVGDHEGRIYLVFEHVKGQSLRAEMAGRPLNVRRAVEMAIQIADAVADAHAAGFVHGGLSPDSILVTARGHAKIPVFELAARGGFEHAGGEVRLRDYESPEEARGEKADDRSDIYSVGAILYEMLTTRRPMHRGASAPSASNARVPRELDDVVLRAVQPDTELRCQSAATLAAELRSVAAILEVRGGPDDEEVAPAEAPATVGRVLATTTAILLLAVLVIWWFMR